MGSIDVLKEWDRKTRGTIKNVMLFVSDCLRWDYLPESVAQRGVTYKTIASSLFTASSFASIVTGLYPPNHGVYSFLNRLPASMRSLMNLEGYNTSLWTENTWMRANPPEASPLHQLLRQNKRIPLEKIEPPFVWLEDEKGGHCPYGWPFFEDEEYEEWECVKFIRNHGAEGEDKLRERYQRGINRSVNEFEKRLKVLEKRGLSESTLVLFISDHGERLGEYGGQIGHEDPTCPELVYVPTVFIHPLLPSGITVQGKGVMRHVDLYPTLADILGIEVKDFTDGVSILRVDQLPRFGYCYYEAKRSKKWLGVSVGHRFKEISVWDKEGGHLFRETNLFKSLLYGISKFVLADGAGPIYLRVNLKTKLSPQMLRNCVTVLKYHVDPHERYGSPSFDKEDAKILVRKIENGERERERIRKSVKKLREEGKI